MRVHKMDLPHRVILGADVIDRVAEFVERKPGIALIVTGERTYEIAGKRVRDSLESAGRSAEVVFVRDPTIDAAESVAAKASEAELIVGVGGGKNLDVAKYAAFKAAKDFVSVPTNASHDGIASHIASLYDSGIRRSIPTRPPVLVVADVRVIAEAPYRFTRAGVGDAISNITAVRDRLLAHKLRGEYYSEYAAELARLSAELVIRNAPIIKEGVLEGIRVLIKALISSGVAMAIAGSSRPASGAEHLFAHALERIRPGVALHGEMVGVGTIMMAYLHGIDRKAIREALISVGAPVDHAGLGVEPEDIVNALTAAHTIRRRFTILGERGITREAAIKLAERTLVIPRGAVDVRA